MKVDEGSTIEPSPRVNLEELTSVSRERKKEPEASLQERAQSRERPATNKSDVRRSPLAERLGTPLSKQSKMSGL